ncbi:hypothetical protein V6N11_063373 [Hibiscus sabdariffa]|uniref:Uncharacterized protein n=2 Tax=Hibiscus sabdariffa TaxID=183260 RepID=A0ABR2FY90_9ROSI
MQRSFPSPRILGLELFIIIVLSLLAPILQSPLWKGVMMVLMPQLLGGVRGKISGLKGKGAVAPRGLKVKVNHPTRGNGGMPPNDLVQHISARLDAASHSGNSILGVNVDSSMLQSPQGNTSYLEDIQNVELLDVPVQGVGSQVRLG